MKKYYHTLGTLGRYTGFDYIAMKIYRNKSTNILRQANEDLADARIVENWLEELKSEKNIAQFFRKLDSHELHTREVVGNSPIIHQELANKINLENSDKIYIYEKMLFSGYKPSKELTEFYFQSTPTSYKLFLDRFPNYESASVEDILCFCLEQGWIDVSMWGYKLKFRSEKVIDLIIELTPNAINNIPLNLITYHDQIKALQKDSDAFHGMRPYQQTWEYMLKNHMDVVNDFISNAFRNAKIYGVIEPKYQPNADMWFKIFSYDPNLLYFFELDSSDFIHAKAGAEKLRTLEQEKQLHDNYANNKENVPEEVEEEDHRLSTVIGKIMKFANEVKLTPIIEPSLEKTMDFYEFQAFHGTLNFYQIIDSFFALHDGNLPMNYIGQILVRYLDLTLLSYLRKKLPNGEVTDDMYVEAIVLQPSMILGKMHKLGILSSDILRKWQDRQLKENEVNFENILQNSDDGKILSHDEDRTSRVVVMRSDFCYYLTLYGVMPHRNILINLGADFVSNIYSVDDSEEKRILKTQKYYTTLTEGKFFDNWMDLHNKKGTLKTFDVDHFNSILQSNLAVKPNIIFQALLFKQRGLIPEIKNESFFVAIESSNDDILKRLSQYDLPKEVRFKILEKSPYLIYNMPKITHEDVKKAIESQPEIIIGMFNDDKLKGFVDGPNNVESLMVAMTNDSNLINYPAIKAHPNFTKALQMLNESLSGPTKEIEEVEDEDYKLSGSLGFISRTAQDQVIMDKNTDFDTFRSTSALIDDFLELKGNQISDADFATFLLYYGSHGRVINYIIEKIGRQNITDDMCIKALDDGFQNLDVLHEAGILSSRVLQKWQEKYTDKDGKVNTFAMAEMNGKGGEHNANDKESVRMSMIAKTTRYLLLYDVLPSNSFLAYMNEMVGVDIDSLDSKNRLLEIQKIFAKNNDKFFQEYKKKCIADSKPFWEILAEKMNYVSTYEATTILIDILSETRNNEIPLEVWSISVKGDTDYLIKEIGKNNLTIPMEVRRLILEKNADYIYDLPDVTAEDINNAVRSKPNIVRILANYGPLTNLINSEIILFAMRHSYDVVESTELKDSPNYRIRDEYKRAYEKYTNEINERISGPKPEIDIDVEDENYKLSENKTDNLKLAVANRILISMVSLDDLPDLPGTVALNEGYVRRYHQTKMNNIESIAKNGIKLEYARGIEGPKAIWADERGFYGKPGDVPTVEFQVPADQCDGPFILRDVLPDEIIAIHLPWHQHARHIIGDEGSLKETINGENDDLLKWNEYRPAIEYVKRHYK